MNNFRLIIKRHTIVFSKFALPKIRAYTSIHRMTLSHPMNIKPVKLSESFGCYAGRYFIPHFYFNFYPQIKTINETQKKNKMAI